MNQFVAKRSLARVGIIATAMTVIACGGAENRLPAARVLTTEHERPSTGEYSPDGSRLAYWTQGPEGAELYVANADMSDPVKIVETLEGGLPVWSPDGQEIAFVNFRGGIDVWVAPALGGDPRQLTDAPGLEFPMQWHPDGDRLAYFATLEGGTIRSKVLHVESMISVPMTNETRPAIGIWSPDGTMMAYVLGFFGAGGTLWIADASGADARQLTMEEHVVGVDWSPDGTQLYYVSRRTGFGDIWVVPVDGGDARQLTRDVRDDSQAWWSPDGSWLAFLSERGRQTDVWLVSVDGGPEIRVTDDTDQETDLRWRPGTTELKYEVETQREALWALSLSDGAERQLTGDTIRIGQIDLSPNGTDIAYTIIRGGGVTDLYLVSTTRN